MNPDITIKIIEIILQLILVIFAGIALSAWKKEIRGKDKYKFAKDLLTYIRELRFLIHSNKGSYHQIYINDIFVDKDNFYKDQLSLIKDEKIYFDQSVWGLFSHINTRADILLPRQVRVLLDELCPRSGKRAGTKSQNTYIQLGGVEVPPMTAIDEKEDFTNVIYSMDNTRDMTLKEYFERWEKLVIELKKTI